jgi:hypothetical protein
LVLQMNGAPKWTLTGDKIPDFSPDFRDFCEIQGLFPTNIFYKSNKNVLVGLVKILSYKDPCKSCLNHTCMVESFNPFQ